MGKKYIVELGRCERLYKAYIDGNGKPELTWLSPEVDLTPYTEPDIEQIRKDAYEEGYHAGFGRKIDTSYQEGLADAWEAARKIVTMPDRDFINSDILDLDPGESIFIKYTATEAIEKIRQYEQEKEEQDGLRQNIQTIVDQCGYTLDEIAAVLEKMRGDQE